MALAITVFATGCKDNDSIIDNPTGVGNDHEAISFTMSDGQGSNTRALTRANTSGFTGTTRIIARLQSDNKGTGGGTKYNKTSLNATVPSTDGKDYYEVKYTDGNTRYWDDAFGRNAQLSVYAVCIPNNSSTTSKLGYDLVTGNATWDTETTPNNSISWSVSQDQSTTGTLVAEDLAYSNNIQKNENRNVDKNYDGTAESVTYGTDGVYRFNFNSNAYEPTDGGSSVTHSDGYMLFSMKEGSSSDAPGKFDKGHLKFEHSLSRITIELVKGTGFGSAATDFSFKSETQIELLTVPYSGSFNIRDGVWAASPTTGSITKMEKTGDGTNAAGTYSAQFLPGYKFAKDANTNFATFTIDNNTYYITQGMVFNALTYDANGDGVKDTGDGDLISMKNESAIFMQQGTNYKFKITVNKTKIDNVTASIVAWSDVTAAPQSIDNAHFTFSDFYNNGTKEASDVHLFRITEALDNIWTTGDYPTGKGEAYQGKYKDDEATMTAPTSGSYVWSTNWYFDNNQTLYHIRSLNTLACQGTGASATDKANLADDASNHSYFKMENGTQAAADYHWGAPMQSAETTKFKYSETDGFKAHLHKGLPAITNTAEAPINLTELHMMSNIEVIVRTPGTVSDGTPAYGTNGVKLVNGSDQTVVTITRLYNKANVDMGIGLVTVDNAETNTETDLNKVTAGVKAGEVMTNPASTLVQKSETVNSETKTYVATQAYTYAVVPQNLCRAASGATDNDYVGITIKTPDNNEYYVVKKLSEIKPTNVGTSQNQTASDYITRWYPNHKYIYTFTISKKGIEAITCTIADWTTVTAGNTDIDLES